MWATWQEEQVDQCQTELHEALNDAVENQTIIEPLFNQTEKTADRSRSLVGIEL